MNTLPSAKDIALSPFCFWGNLCARLLLSGDLVIVRRTGSKGRKNIEAPPNEKNGFPRRTRRRKPERTVYIFLIVMGARN